MGKFNYHTLSDKALRKMLGDLGLPTKGEKADLVWLHREYVLKYNANCDSE